MASSTLLAGDARALGHTQKASFIGVDLLLSIGTRRAVDLLEMSDQFFAIPDWRSGLSVGHFA
jgi:hypothetical protein